MTKVDLSREDYRRAVLDSHRRAAQGRAEAGISDRVLWMTKVAERSRALAADLRAKLDPKKPDPNARRAITTHEANAKRYEAAAVKMQREEVDRLWAERASVETEEMALLRGEEITRTKVETQAEDPAAAPGKAGTVTSTSKPQAIWSGLEHALHKGYLKGLHGCPGPEVLMAAGAAYREAFEITVGRVSRTGGGGGGGARGPQLKIIEAADRLSIMRKGLTPRQMIVLDMVCGEDMRARAVATQLGYGFPSTTRALRGGLQVAHENWQEANRKGAVGHVASRVQEASRALEKMIPARVR